MTILHLRDEFWDEEFTGSNGFEKLVIRADAGLAMLHGLEKFMKTRVKVEEDYATQLQKLVKNASAALDNGTLSRSWVAFIDQTDQIAKEHLQAAAAMADAQKRLSELREKQITSKPKEQANLQKMIKVKHEKLEKTKELKKLYEIKQKEEKDISLQIEASQRAKKHKDIQKLYTKRTKCQQEKEAQKREHSASLVGLHDICNQWIGGLINFCNLLEQQEKDRNNFMQNEIWAHCNIMAITCVDDDKHYEHVRKILEKCDPEKDLSDFISENKTGSKKPEIPQEVQLQQDEWVGAKASMQVAPQQPMMRVIPQRPMAFAAVPFRLPNKHGAGHHQGK